MVLLIDISVGEGVEERPGKWEGRFLDSGGRLSRIASRRGLTGG